MAIGVAREGLEAAPPVPPPRGLVPLLAFTRFPDRALAAARRVIDDDHVFRQRVRSATTEQELGRASWLFLDRPDGWEEELSGLVAAAEQAADAAKKSKAEAPLRRQMAALEANVEQANRDVARLRAETAAAKDQLAAERRGRWLAESDAGRLRRETIELQAEVNGLRLRQAELEEALDSVAQEPPPAAEPAPDELVPPPRQIDQVALARLMADGQRAAESLAKVLAEAERMVAPMPDPHPRARTESHGLTAQPPTLERRQPTALPPGTFDDSVEAADHLVRTAGVRILVDGYNVTKTARPELSLPEQRRWLVDAVVELAARTGARIELVFDGADDRSSAPADLGRRQGVQVRYTAEGVEADDVLLELVEEAPPSVPVVVASDDRRVRDGARHRGANVVSTLQLLTVLNR